MEILNLSESGAPKPQKSRAVRAVFGAALIAGVATLSSTLAANININSGPVEFGQGVAQTVSCGDSEVPIIVTPSSSFTNSDGGAFAMSSITLSDIPAACNGKVFTIKVYDNSSSTALTVADWGMAAPDNSFQLWWADGYSNPQGGTTPDNYAMLHFAQDLWFTDCYGFDNGGPGYLETGAEDHGSSLAGGTAKITLPLPIDATHVYKITLETQDDSASFVDYGYDSAENTTSFGQFWADYIW